MLGHDKFGTPKGVQNMKKKGIHPETAGPAAGMAAFEQFKNEFEKGMQRPLKAKEKEFLKWLTKEHLVQNEDEGNVMHGPRTQRSLKKRDGLTGFSKTR